MSKEKPVSITKHKLIRCPHCGKDVDLELTQSVGDLVFEKLCPACGVTIKIAIEGHKGLSRYIYRFTMMELSVIDRFIDVWNRTRGNKLDRQAAMHQILLDLDMGLDEMEAQAKAKK